MIEGKLQVGIVGAPRGSGFMAGFGAVSETEVVAFCDARPEALARAGERFGVARRYTELAAMLDSDIDIVVVATPMPLHGPMAVQALNAGKHVMSEVPAATDLDQCWELIQAVRRSGQKYMMAENYCYRKNSMLLKSMAEQGLFGELYFGEGEYIHELKELNEQTKWRRRWQTGLNGNTYPTHSLGPLLQWMRDRVVSVSCMGSGHHYRDPRGAIYENEDTTLTLCKLASGGLIKLRLDMLSERPHHLTYYALQGTKGCYEEARGLGDMAKVWLEDHSEKKYAWRPLADFEAEFLPEWWRNPPEEAVRAGHGGGDYFEVRDFVDSILRDTEPPISVYTALDYTVPGLVSQVSIAQGGTALPVPDFRAIQRYPEDLPAELRESSIRSVRA